MQSVGGFVCRSLHCCRRRSPAPPSTSSSISTRRCGQAILLESRRLSIKIAVLAYRHVYCRERPERAYRDHDNIEVNMVTDIITLYLLPDDAPRRCAHYYCSAAGAEDQTEVYVIPTSRFPTWLAAEQANDLEEERLYETSEIWD